MFIFFIKIFIFKEVLSLNCELFDFIILIVFFLNINIGIVMLYLYKIYCNI